MPRPIIAAFLLIEFVWWKAAAPSPIGYYLHIERHETHVAGGSHPLAIAFSMVGILLYLWLLGARIEVRMTRKAPMWRRFGTFLIDFYFAGSTIMWLIGLLAIVVESGRTGTFHWHFEREYGVSLDRILGVPLVVISMTLIFLYFAYPLTKAKQTVGCYAANRDLQRVGSRHSSRDATRSSSQANRLRVPWPVRLVEIVPTESEWPNLVRRKNQSNRAALLKRF